MFAAYHQMCQPTTSSSTVSTSRRADVLPPTGSVHLAGQGRHGYNRRKRITGAQLTRCGHRRRIARCGGRYGPRWSGAAVSESVNCWNVLMWPRVGSGVERLDSLRFLAGCRKMQLNHALSVLSLSLVFLSVSLVLLTRGTFSILLFCVIRVSCLLVVLVRL